MADHRMKISASDPDLHFRMAMDVLETVEYLEARGEPVTPATLYQRLQASPNGDPTITISRIEQGLIQVQFWRKRFVTREIVHHRHHLAALADQVQGEIWRLQQYQYYFDVLLRHADALLKTTLTFPTDGPAEASGAVGPRLRR